MHNIAQWLAQHNRIAIAGHVSPDGDSYGSCLALCQALRCMGKQAFVAAPAVPMMYDFLPFKEQIFQMENLPFVPEACLFVDVSSPERAGMPMPQNLPTALIDHHETNAGFADVRWIDGHAASTGEMVYQLLIYMQAEISPDMAACLYTAMSTDTGNFQFPSTTSMTLCATAHLLECGLEIGKYSALLFRRRTLARTQLLGKALSTMQISADGKTAITIVTRQMMQECSASHADTEGIVNYLNEIDGVQAAAMLEERESSVKVSLRSQEQIDVSAIAHALGGGGHRLAAGITLDMTVEDAFSTIAQKLQEATR